MGSPVLDPYEELQPRLSRWLRGFSLAGAAVSAFGVLLDLSPLRDPWARPFMAAGLLLLILAPLSTLLVLLWTGIKARDRVRIGLAFWVLLVLGASAFVRR